MPRWATQHEGCDRSWSRPPLRTISARMTSTVSFAPEPLRLLPTGVGLLGQAGDDEANLDELAAGLSASGHSHGLPISALCECNAGRSLRNLGLRPRSYAKRSCSRCPQWCRDGSGWSDQHQRHLREQRLASTAEVACACTWTCPVRPRRFAALPGPPGDVSELRNSVVRIGTMGPSNCASGVPHERSRNDPHRLQDRTLGCAGN